MNGKERTQIEALQKNVGELRVEFNDFRKDTATKSDIRWLKWGITLGFGIMTAVIVIGGV